jgi:redox-sensitive bicupin YhaK (pirin superfamily)
MERKEFLRKTLMGAAATAIGGVVIKELQAHPLQNNTIGFNHLPHQHNITMKNMIIHQAATRGHANHGWLDSHHTFSFASYYNPERMHFGVLRVLNDDMVQGGMGFGIHPHDNMEIISIPLSGDLEHKDSMGNTTVIKQGDVQIMSAGTGIQHSEYNRNKEKPVKFLQIWVFPKERNIKPRYDQKTFNTADRINTWQQVVSPSGTAEGIDIHQDAWFNMTLLKKGNQLDYTIQKKGNGVYAFILSGDVTINGQELHTRDGIGIWDTEKINVAANSDAEILLMDVPMSLD